MHPNVRFIRLLLVPLALSLTSCVEPDTGMDIGDASTGAVVEPEDAPDDDPATPGDMPSGCEDGAPDADNDGVPDACDVCPGLDDSAGDGDGDGVPDPCDVCPDGDDSTDADGDETPDACDVCPDGDDRSDADGDGTPDGCDVCPGFDDAQDVDGDGVPNGCDSCPEDAADADDDGIPDACDVCPGASDAEDEDQDGVPDGCDACPGFDDTIDVDGNGQPDGCQSCDVDYAQGHGDLFARYDANSGDLELSLRSSLGQPGPETLHEPATICIVVPYSSYEMAVSEGGRPTTGQTPDPFDAIGVAAGEPFWFLSASNLAAMQPFFGVSTEGIPPGTLAGPVTFTMTVEQRPTGAEMSVYQLPFLPEFFLSTAHPTSAAPLEMAEAGHDHYNWSFSDAGEYLLTVSASAPLASGGTATSPPATYTFRVESL